MSNPYFTFSNAVARLSRARSSWANTIGAAVEAAFDLLPSPTQLFTETATYGVDSGGPNAYAVALPLGAYVDGMKVRVKIGSSNTGPCTLNVNGLGARAVKKPDGADPAAADLLAGSVHEFVYNATTSRFVLTTVTSSDLAEAAASATAATNAKTAAEAARDAALAAAQDAEDEAEALADSSVAKSGGTMTGQLAHSGGSVSTPWIVVSSKTNTGFYFGTVSGVLAPAFAIDGALAAIVSPPGTGAPATATVMTREKTDHRYVRGDTNGELNGNFTVTGQFTVQSSAIIEGSAYIKGNVFVDANSAGSIAQIMLRNHTGGSARGVLYADASATFVRLLKYTSGGDTDVYLNLVAGDARLEAASGSPSAATSLMTRARGDARYAGVGDAYTKAQSDGRYVLPGNDLRANLAASLGFNQVGSFAFASMPPADRGAGATIAGSALNSAHFLESEGDDIRGGPSAATLSGTWRLLNTTISAGSFAFALVQRIS